MPYAFKHDDNVFTPSGKADIQDVNAHNAAVEAAELAAWEQKPDRWHVYIVKLADGYWHATNWLGRRLDTDGVKINTFHGNIARNMRSVRFTGTNGAVYYGRYGSDWRDLCFVRKAK